MPEELSMEEKFVLIQIQEEYSILAVAMLLGQGLMPSQIEPLFNEYLKATVH